MKLKIISIFNVFLFSLLALNSIEANAQTYLPVGPQTNVPVATVTNGGWAECYRDFYANSMDVNTVLSDCPGSQLMLACRETGSSTLTLLAQGARSDVTFDTGTDQSSTHIANGVGWYFHVGTFPGSWGFARAGDPVNKSNCDFLDAPNSNERLCWHTLDVSGYRCGVNVSLSTESWERIVYMAEPAQPQVITAVPTLSEWGLVAMASVLGLVGFLVIRRKATA